MSPNAIAEMEAVRPLAAPWQVRYRKWIIAGLIGAAIVGLPALGAYAWRTWGPNPLDDLKIVLPAQPSALPQDARPTPTPAPSRAVPAAPPPVEVLQKRSEPATKSRAAIPEPVESRSSVGLGSRSSVTHTRRAEAAAGVPPGVTASRPQPSARAQDPRPASPAECTEAVAALGLCTSTPAAKAGQ